MSSPSIVIASAGRTAVGSFNGSFANTPAHELGIAVINGVLATLISAGKLGRIPVVDEPESPSAMPTDE